MSGLIETMKVSSDTARNLKLALAIPLEWNRKVSHYAVSKDERGADVLHLYWTDKSEDRDPKTFKAIERDVQKVPFTPLDTDEKVFNFVQSWLAQADHGEDPMSDGDGSSNKGWIVEVCDSDFYEVMRVTASWIYYSK
jgi:hypothetical protein